MAAATLPTPEHKPVISKGLARIVYIVVIAAMALAMFLTATRDSQIAAEEAAAAGTASEFAIDDMFQPWSWIVLAGSFVITVVHSLAQGAPVGSTMQIALIVLLLICFVMIAQQTDRDFYRVGLTALIFLTLLQIGFGNISPEANLRQSVIGVVITAVILGVIIWLSIALVPSLIQLGRGG
jgi:prepilin signal peptidase PulO-like enzyme (type II secretory pathway)